jgi:hypothetical protein
MGSAGGDDNSPGSGDGLCCCARDPFATVRPELRPQLQSKRSLRHAECPSCGQEYWTNRETDFCMDCETDLGPDRPRQAAHK